MPFKAWLKSLPIILLGPVMVWSTLVMIAWASTGELSAFAGYSRVGWQVIGIPLAAHLGCYALFGIPLFSFGYASHGHFIWKPVIALLVGASLGGGTCALLVGDLMLGQATDIPIILSMIGMAYGIWTAAWARRFRPITVTPSRRPVPPAGHWLEWFGH